MRPLVAVTEARLALGPRLANLRPDAGALNPIQFRPAAADQPIWACRSIVMVCASRRVSIPLVLTPPGFIQISDLARVKLARQY